LTYLEAREAIKQFAWSIKKEKEVKE